MLKLRIEYIEPDNPNSGFRAYLGKMHVALACNWKYANSTEEWRDPSILVDDWTVDFYRFHMRISSNQPEYGYHREFTSVEDAVQFVIENVREFFAEAGDASIFSTEYEVFVWKP